MATLPVLLGTAEDLRWGRRRTGPAMLPGGFAGLVRLKCIAKAPYKSSECGICVVLGRRLNSMAHPEQHILTPNQACLSDVSEEKFIDLTDNGWVHLFCRKYH